MLMPCDNCMGKELAIFSVTEHFESGDEPDDQYWICEKCVVKFMKRGNQYLVRVVKE